MNDLLPPRAPRGPNLYMTVRSALPPRGSDALGALATGIRRMRLRLRLWRQRWIRRVRRSGRRLVRHSGTRVRRLRGRMRHFLRRRVARQRSSVQRLTAGRFGPRTSAHSNPADEQSESRVAAWATRALRELFPPALSLPGDGPTVAVDARGLSCREVLGKLAGLNTRTIVVVDDPDIIELRSTGVYYEFAPATEFASADERMQWIIDAYGVDRVERMMPSAGEFGGLDAISSDRS